MHDTFPYDVFLSHSTIDKPVVRELAERLRSDGLKVWFDEWVISIGQSVPAKIDEGLEQSRIFILCMSANSSDSEWAQFEQYSRRFNDPMNRGGRFIPLRLDGSPLKPSLAHFLYVNWSSGNRESEYAKLLEACQETATQPMTWAPSMLMKQPNNLPFLSLRSLFKGREEFLNKVHLGLGHGHHVSAIVGTQALHGLGGLGKTRAAIEYAWKHAGDYKALLFAMAETPETLEKSLADLCDPLILDLPEQSETEQQVRYMATLSWLRSHPGWLLILDNVDNEAAAASVESLLPQLPTGHLLITSRFGDWSASVSRLDLPLLSREASIEFLMERTQGNRRLEADEAVAAIELAEELDGLPLALEQAAAFMNTTQESFAGYLRRWKAHEKRVRTWHDSVRMQYPRSLAITWDTSVAQLDSAGRSLLNSLCWFSPDPIPVALWNSVKLPRRKLRPLVRWFLSKCRMLEPDTNAEHALAQLGRYGLLQWNSDRSAFSVHRLVQEVTRDKLSGSESLQSLANSVLVMNAYLPHDPRPDDVRSWPMWDPVRTHVSALVHHADRRGIVIPTARLMQGLGILLYSKQLCRDAEPLLRRVLEIAEKYYPTEYSIVSVHLNDLALLLGDTNRFEEAEIQFRRALAITEKQYGDAHPEVACILSNLSIHLHAMNRFEEAESLIRRALAIDVDAYGETHPHTALRINNLAQVLKSQNRLPEAQRLMEQVFSIDEQLYGEVHPNVARDLNNLATSLMDLDDLAGAEPLLRRALAIDQQLYGDQHPAVARDLNNLALCMKGTEQFLEAEQLQRRSLAIDETAYGADHPNVARDLNNLGTTLLSAERFEEAELVFRRAISIDELAFGGDHPKVSVHLNNLATLLQRMNRYEEAEELLKRSLKIDEEFYGADHADVARDLNKLGLLHFRSWRLTEAEERMRRALKINEQCYGPMYKHLAIDHVNLGQLLLATDRASDAETHLRCAVSILESSPSTDPAHMVQCLNLLAKVLTVTGRLDEAVLISQRALSIGEKTYGSNHPAVESAVFNLANLFAAKGRLEEAEPLLRRSIALEGIDSADSSLALKLGLYAGVLQGTGRASEAAQAMKRAIDILRRVGPSNLEQSPHWQVLLDQHRALCQAAESQAEAKNQQS